MLDEVKLRVRAHDPVSSAMAAERSIRLRKLVLRMSVIFKWSSVGHWFQ